MSEISAERMERLWRWCGWQYEEPKCDCPGCAKSCWVPPDKPTAHDGRYLTCGLPDLDLNNLFKWAVPKLSVVVLSKVDDYLFLARAATAEAGVSTIEDEDPAIALFLAIEKMALVTEGNDANT